MRADLLGEMLVKTPAFVGRGRGREARAIALCFGCKRELRDDQRRAANIGEGTIHATRVVCKDTQIDQLAGKPFGLRLRISPHGADKHEQPRTDLPGDLSIDRDIGLRDALDERAHQVST